MSGRLLVINPVAGRGAEPSEIVRAVRAASGGDVEIEVTAEPGDARRFGRRGAKSGVGEVWVAGGDGTLHEVVQGLLEETADEPPQLVPLPLGTGNDLVRSLGVPLDWDEAVQTLGASRHTVEIDLMEVTLDGERQLGLNVVIAGNGGRVGEVLDHDGKSWWGPLAYLRSAAEIATALEPLEVLLSADTAPSKPRRVLNVIVANGRYAGHGIPVAPGARPDDGVLELVTVEEAALTEVFGMLPSLLDESEPRHEAWQQQTVTSANLEAVGADPIPVSVDGENHSARKVTVALHGSRLPVRVPTESAGDARAG